jgi:hypothetical protein
MIPIRFNSKNVLKRDDKNNIVDLHFNPTKSEDGINIYQTYWRLSKEEIDFVNEHGYVVLNVYGNMHPPVSLQVGNQEHAEQLAYLEKEQDEIDYKKLLNDENLN